MCVHRYWSFLFLLFNGYFFISYMFFYFSSLSIFPIESLETGLCAQYNFKPLLSFSLLVLKTEGDEYKTSQHGIVAMKTRHLWSLLSGWWITNGEQSCGTFLQRHNLDQMFVTGDVTLWEALCYSPSCIKEVRDIMKMWVVESSCAVLQFSNWVVVI